MCLYTKQICPAKARKDIVCYKVFVEGVRLTTPIVGHKIENPHYTGVPFLMDDSDKDKPNNRRSNNMVCKFGVGPIGKGMIHAYQNVECAKLARDFFGLYASLKTYECIIPKGTLYFKGTDGDICSRKLLIVKRVVD